MDLEKIIIYFIDKNDNNHNISVSFEEANQHAAAYEILLKKKYKYKDEIIIKDDNIYIPSEWDNFHITKDLVSLGHVVFLNDREGSCEIAIPENLTLKEAIDLESILSELEKFDLSLWQVNDDGNYFDYKDLDPAANSMEILKGKIKETKQLLLNQDKKIG